MLIPLGTLASAGGGWTPAELTNVAAWYDASDTATITSSSNLVSQWNDKSANAKNLVQASSGNQPSTGLSTQNGRNLIQFADSKALQATGTAGYWAPFSSQKTLIAIACIPETNNGNFLSTNSKASDISGFEIEWQDTNQAKMLVASSGAYVVINQQNGTITNRSSFAVFTYVTDPANGTAANRSEVYENNSTATKANTQTASPDTTVSSSLLMGMTDSTGVSTKVGEIVMVTGADATEDNRLLLKTYLMAKWGI